MNDCNFCKKIYSKEELNENSELKESNYITFNKEDNRFCIYHVCEDDYFSDEILFINYCPKCGRKLDPSNHIKEINNQSISHAAKHVSEVLGEDNISNMMNDLNGILTKYKNIYLKSLVAKSDKMILDKISQPSEDTDNDYKLYTQKAQSTNEVMHNMQQIDKEMVENCIDNYQKFLQSDLWKKINKELDKGN